MNYILFLNFASTTHSEEFKSFLYSVNGNCWETAEEVTQGSWKLSFANVTEAYRFGYGWAAHQWSIERKNYFYKEA